MSRRRSVIKRAKIRRIHKMQADAIIMAVLENVFIRFGEALNRMLCEKMASLDPFPILSEPLEFNIDDRRAGPPRYVPHLREGERAIETISGKTIVVSVR